MSAQLVSIVLFFVFAVVTYGLSIIGMRQTTSLKTFAIGKGDMSPWLAGVTMAASVASTATFVINPGFVYRDGLSAWAHYGLGAMLGLITALLVLSRGFQRLGKELKVLTLPDFVRKRYRSRRLGMAFAAMTLFYISFIVLILSGSALIVQQLFELEYHTALVFLMVFVFGYVLMGGTYAHAYTNAMQGMMMIGIALLVFGSGAKHFGIDFFTKLETVGEHYAAWMNPESDLYGDFFSVFVSSFLITFALMLQPHILTKVLYLKEDKRDLRVFLWVTIAVSIVFSSMLFVGFFARLDGLVIDRQDTVVLQYLPTVFSPYWVGIIFVSLLAAGLSTLDGILVAISSVVVADLILPGQDINGPEHAKRALAMSRYVLVAVGLLSLAIAWEPPARLGLFAQQGVYALVAASAAPLILGILYPSAQRPERVFGLSLLALSVHFAMRYGFDVLNPGTTASVGILCSFVLGGWWFRPWARNRDEVESWPRVASNPPSQTDDVFTDANSVA